MIESPRHTHFADIIYRKHLENAPALVNKIAETHPDFAEFFCFYYAMEQAGRSHRKSRKGNIYFMRDTSTGDIKIGYSEDNVPLRAKFHAATRQAEVETLLTLKGVYNDETIFHQMFDLHNIDGEWYKGSPEVMDGITAMQRLYKSSPNADMADFMEEARWGLLFYAREAECYRKMLAVKS